MQVPPCPPQRHQLGALAVEDGTTAAALRPRAAIELEHVSVAHYVAEASTSRKFWRTVRR